MIRASVARAEWWDPGWDTLADQHLKLITGQTNLTYDAYKLSNQMNRFGVALCSGEQKGIKRWEKTWEPARLETYMNPLPHVANHTQHITFSHILRKPACWEPTPTHVCDNTIYPANQFHLTANITQPVQLKILCAALPSQLLHLSYDSRQPPSLWYLD